MSRLRLTTHLRAGNPSQPLATNPKLQILQEQFFFNFNFGFKFNEWLTLFNGKW